MMPLLRPHQEEALAKLHDGSILCGAPGTGKSRVALAYYYTSCGGKLGEEFDDFIFPKNPKDLYIITTAQKRDKKDWENEMLPFSLSAKAVDSWNNIKKYKRIYNAFFIFDEQHVKGYGPWTKAFLDIARKNRWILLSATPGDKWEDYIPVFIANGFFKNKSEFNNDHVIFSPYMKYPKPLKYVNTGRLIKYRNSIVVNMPLVRDTTRQYFRIEVNYDLDKYKLIRKHRWDPYNDEPIQEIAKYCYLLRRVCNEDKSRVEALYDIWLSHPKLIVFYSFNYELAILKMFCDSVGVTYGEWNGHKHEEVPTTDKWIYLVNYASGAEGWNCITTDTIVFYSQQYSYSTAIQAEGRTDRLNTPYKFLYYYKLISRSPIDYAIESAFLSKKDFNENTFVGKQT